MVAEYNTEYFKTRLFLFQRLHLTYCKRRFVIQNIVIDRRLYRVNSSKPNLEDVCNYLIIDVDNGMIGQLSTIAVRETPP